MKKHMKHWILYDYNGPSGKGTYVLTLVLPKRFRAKWDKFSGEITVYETSKQRKLPKGLEKNIKVYNH